MHNTDKDLSLLWDSPTVSALLLTYSVKIISRKLPGKKSVHITKYISFNATCFDFKIHPAKILVIKHKNINISFRTEFYERNLCILFQFCSKYFSLNVAFKGRNVLQ